MAPMSDIRRIVVPQGPSSQRICINSVLKAAGQNGEIPVSQSMNLAFNRCPKFVKGGRGARGITYRIVV